MPEEFSKKERERISHQLDKRLGQEYLSVRQGGGNTKLTYVEGWRIIGLANKILGFDGWSSEIKNYVQEYSDTLDGKTSVGYSCMCRVTLKNGIFKEDIGFGSSENQRLKGMAIEKAKKEAATDSLKRALRQFGNALGNCCYDKQFLIDLYKSKGQKKPGVFNINKLLSHTDLTFENESEKGREVSFSQEPEISDT